MEITRAEAPTGATSSTAPDGSQSAAPQSGPVLRGTLGPVLRGELDPEPRPKPTLGDVLRTTQGEGTRAKVAQPRGNSALLIAAALGVGALVILGGRRR